jgi:hypothetical protein
MPPLIVKVAPKLGPLASLDASPCQKIQQPAESLPKKLVWLMSFLVEFARQVLGLLVSAFDELAQAQPEGP